jgi:Periplasmic copper-binding protein (NosD)
VRRIRDADPTDVGAEEIRESTSIRTNVLSKELAQSNTMSTGRLLYVVAIAAVMVLSVVLAAPALAGVPSAVPRPASSAAEITVGPVIVPGISPDAGPYTIISPSCTVSGGVASITTSGSTFTVDGAFTGAIVDECANSVLNDANYTITPSAGTSFGVQVNSTSGVTVENVVVGGTPDDAVEILNSTYTSAVNIVSSTGQDYGVYAENDFGVNVTGSQLNGSVAAGVGTYLVQNISVSNSYACGGADGISDQTSSGITVVHLTATADFDGAYLDGSTNVTLSDDNFSKETGAAILEMFDDGVAIVGVNASGSAQGVEATLSLETTVEDSNLSAETAFGFNGAIDTGVNITGSNLSGAREVGAIAGSSSALSFWGDDFNDSGLYGVDVENSTGILIGSSWGWNDTWSGLRAVDTSDLTSWHNVWDNSVAGNGTLLIQASDTTITGDQDWNDSYGFLDSGSSDLTVRGVNLTNDTESFSFLRDNGVTVTDSSVFDVALGTLFFASQDDTVVNYTAVNTTVFGVELTGSSDISVSDSRVVGTPVVSTAGLLVQDSSDVTLFNDSSRNFNSGVFLAGTVNVTVDDVNATGDPSSGEALLVSGCRGLTVEDGNFSSSYLGLYLDDGNGPAWVIANTFFDDSTDFVVDAAAQVGVHVYWNNFIDGGGWSVYAVGWTGSDLVFADGYPGGGNYWSNWTSPDSESGPQQNLPGSDGIVDLPLNISGALQDPYPLTHAVSVADTNVQFVATGLPGGTSWGVTFNGTVQSTTSNSLLFSTNTAAIGVSLGYSVNAPAGWSATPSADQVLTDGSPLVVMLDFARVTYTAAFTQTSLPGGTAWSVTVNGTEVSGSTGSLSTALPNGTYDFTVNAVAGYTVSPASGQITIDSAGSSTALTFTPVDYTVDFTEQGLTSGSTWSVTFDGILKSAPSATISFAIANGSYGYRAGNISGYSVVGGSGTLQVAGPGASVQVAYTANSAFGTGSPLFWGLIAAIAILAVALLAVLLMGRRKPPAPNAWTPPPASSGAGAPPTPAAGTPAPPPGATGGAPEWKE